MTSRETVVLPKSIDEICSKYFPNLAKTQTLRLLCGYDQSSLNPAQKMIWKYSGRALLAGRPLDSAIIFMAGVSGSGKSSTINTLFEDNELCKTSSSCTETDHIALVRKLINFNLETPAVQGYLGFVDVPGSFDLNPEKEAQLLSLIKKFKSSRIELVDRDDPILKSTSIRSSVYPNIVLFVVNATDPRMEGKDSQLARSLQALKKLTHIWDKDKQNIIVVLTHVMSLATKKKKFVAKLDEKTKIIKEQFRRILGIVDVDVVPVENRPKDFQSSSSSEDSDSNDGSRKRQQFFVLPNGAVSHLNLYEAMLQRFDNNLDLLGRLLISRYFSASCPERDNKAEIYVYT